MRLLAVLFLGFIPTITHAACDNPQGVEGEIIYNREWKSMQFCDNDKWISMGSSNTGINVTGSAGEIQFSDGADSLASSNKLLWHNDLEKLQIGPSNPTRPSRLHIHTDAGLGNAVTINHYGNIGTNPSGYPYFSMNTYHDGTQWVSPHATIYGTMLENTHNAIHLSSTPPNMLTSAPVTRHLSVDATTGNISIGTTPTTRRLEVAGTTRLEATPPSGQSVLSIRHTSAPMWGDGHTHFGYTTANGTVSNYIRGDSTDINTHIRVTGYAQLEKRQAGPPPAADCDNSYIGRFSLDTANNRLYICMGASRGWDYTALTN